MKFRINDASPWPERVGCIATIADPPSHRRHNYPFATTTHGEVVVLIENDPLHPGPDIGPFAVKDPDDEWWSCVMPDGALDPIEDNV